jgi:hypothetical protein
MEDTAWKRITFFVTQTKVKGQVVDCIRIREVPPKAKDELTPAHPKWSVAQGKKAEGATIAQIRKFYDISESNFNLL